MWVVAYCGFQRKEGQKFGRASSSKRYTVLFLHLLSFFVVVVVVKFVSSDSLSSRSPTDLLEEEDR